MPKFVGSWVELMQCTSETHFLEIGDCNGWIHPKVDLDENSWAGHHYLSTHTFYGGFCEGYTALLQSCGFDVQLANWDEHDSTVLCDIGMQNSRAAMVTVLDQLSAVEQGAYAVDSTKKKKWKYVYCHTCIVGRKTPEACESCNRK